MKKLLSLLFAACLCWLAASAASDTLAQNERKVCICHVPPGNPANEHTICIGAPAVPAHMAHGDSMGDCQAGCDGAAGGTCGADEFCMHPQGACDPSNAGICSPIPETCPPTVARVCGCDGNTYTNACFAAQAGVTVEFLGPCDALQACGGSFIDPCPSGEFCKREDGVCDPGAVGVCVVIPQTCPAAHQPVCGCDGTSYSNTCFTEAVGIAVLRPGSCEAGMTCGGSSSALCPKGMFCKKDEGVCDARAVGVCADIPATCPAVVDPACGCDGTTYSNACVADGAGVTVASSGVCTAQRSRGGTAKGVRPKD